VPLRFNLLFISDRTHNKSNEFFAPLQAIRKIILLLVWKIGGRVSCFGLLIYNFSFQKNALNIKRV